jgi:hypothetical protein
MGVFLTAFRFITAVAVFRRHQKTMNFYQKKTKFYSHSFKIFRINLFVRLYKYRYVSALKVSYIGRYVHDYSISFEDQNFTFCVCYRYGIMV